MQINKSHSEFIRLVSNGSTQTHAYKVTCGNSRVTSSVAKVKGSQLSKRYAVLIAQAKKEAQDIIQQANNTKASQNAQNEVLEKASKIGTQMEVDAINWKIINGEEFEIKQLNAQGKVFKANITPSIAERRAAIETYNKRFGSNEAIKSIITIKEQPLFPDVKCEKSKKINALDQ